MSNAKALKRIPSIDRFRGTVIFSMIIFQFIEYFKNLGAAANIALHAPKEDAFYILPNFAIADIIAPMFILAIGLTYIPSLKRRIERDGKKKGEHPLCRTLSDPYRYRNDDGRGERPARRKR